MKQKQFGLALGGGAARGFIHIGVLKYIEENDIKIRELSGTSMGAIIASMYAIGKTTEEITEISKGLNFLKLIDIDFKTGLIKGKKVEKKLAEIFGDKNIEDLDINLKIVATNLEEGKRFVFTKGKIVDAVRASLSLPGIFVPHKVGNTSYVDGGITNNLPVDVLRTKNCIGVTALKKINGPLQTKRKIFGIKMSKGFLDLNYQILHRTILIMMKQNEDKSIEKKENLTLISPNFLHLDYYNFNKIDEFVEVGYKEAKLKLKNIL